MRKLGLKIDTTRGGITDLADSTVELPQIVYGDHVLFVCSFLESLSSTQTAMNLDGADGLFVTVKKDRLQSDGTILTSQSDYSQSEYAAYEDLTTGKATFVMRFDTAAILSALGSAAYVDVWCEFTLCDMGRRQTLGQLQLRILPCLYEGTCTAPTPTPTPTPTAAP